MRTNKTLVAVSSAMVTRAFQSLVITSMLFLLLVIRTEARMVPQSFADLVEQLSPSVVNITSTTLVNKQPEFNPRIPPGSPFEDFFRDFQDRDNQNNSPQRRRRGSALGSGFIISADGFVVTNNHVIENADEIEVEMIDGTLLQAEVFGRDEKTDIALLKVISENPLPFVKFGDASEARAGDWVLAIGNPLGQGFSVSAGIISARGRSLNGSYDDFIQTDAAINKGNSGGPLFNMAGEVIGVNTAILSPTGGSIGIGFSMSSSVVEKVVSQLQSFGETRRGWLGVRIQDISEDVAEALELDNTKGALITDVPDGPAKIGGLKSGDIIIEFDGKTVDSTRTLVRVVGDSDVGKSVAIKIMRDGETLTRIVTLGRLEEALAQGDQKKREQKRSIIVAGLTVSNITAELKSEMGLSKDFDGLMVSDVKQGSDAEAKGIRMNDIITKVGKKVLSAPFELRDEIDKAIKEGRKSVLLLVYRDGAKRFVALTLED